MPELASPLASDEIRDLVGCRFGDYLDRVSQGAADRDRQGAPLSRDLLREAASLGLTRMVLPAEVAGDASPWSTWGQVLSEIGYRCDETALPALLTLTTSMGMLLASARPQSVGQRWARAIAQDGALVGFAWSEGADPYAFKSVFDRGGRVLTGEKGPLLGAAHVDAFVVFAKDSATDDLVAALVDRCSARVKPIASLGLRAAGFGAVRFERVPLRDEHVLVTADGLSLAQRFLSMGRLQLSCWALGRMRALFESCVGDVSRRERFRMPVSEMQAVQATLGRMAVAVETSRLVVQNALARVDSAGDVATWDVATALSKYWVVEQALALCRGAQRVLGGAAVFEGAPFERHLRDFNTLVANVGTQLVLEIDLGALAVAEIGSRLRGKG